MKMKKHLFAMMAFSAGLGCFAQSGSNDRQAGHEP